MPWASSGALVDSVNVATAWFSFCRAEALRDTAEERLAAVQTQRDHAFPADFPETLIRPIQARSECGLRSRGRRGS
jgi:hypothetical protein